MERSRPAVEDPYHVLGVATGASRQEIVRAYRRAVYDTHPDAQPGDPWAAARFTALTAAYDLLIDPARRAAYDRQHLRPDTAALRPATQVMLTNPHLIWAGPVRAGPVSAERPGSGDSRSAAARFEDPPVFLGRPPRPMEDWPW